jgi:hypothetical protein
MLGITYSFNNMLEIAYLKDNFKNCLHIYYIYILSNLLKLLLDQSLIVIHLKSSDNFKSHVNFERIK